MSLLVTAAVLACQSDVVLTDPARDGRSGLMIRAVFEDTALAHELGSGEGVSGGAVSLRWSTAPALSFPTDSLGLAAVQDLPSRTYWLTAELQLDNAERLRAAGHPHVLGGGAIAALERGRQFTVGLRADDPGSLVISEYYYHGLYRYATNYENSSYLELYNNSDSIIYLDGKIIGSAFKYNFDSPNWRCTETASMRIVEGGVYAQFLHAFPGSGRDHPVRPGDRVLIADQAIDHSAVYADLPDLSDADFEFGFQDRANNPTVADLVEVGLKPITGNTPRRFFPGFDVPFIAVPLDISSLPRRLSPRWVEEYVLVPSAAILDLAAFIGENALEDFWIGVPPCTEGSVHPSLDRRAAWLPSRVNNQWSSVARRRIVESGKLQRTRTSAVDFEIVPRSPGWAP